MRHPLLILLIALATSAALGQTSPGHDEVKQALREALEIQAPAPAALPHLPESPSEPARAVAPEKKPTQAPATRLSREVLERAGRMATQAPASVHAEPTHMGAATAHAAAASQSAAGQSQSEQVRQQHPPRPGTPGGRSPSPPVVSPVSPHSTPPSSGAPGPNGH